MKRFALIALLAWVLMPLKQTAPGDVKPNGEKCGAVVACISVNFPAAIKNLVGFAYSCVISTDASGFPKSNDGKPLDRNLVTNVFNNADAYCWIPDRLGVSDAFVVPTNTARGEILKRDPKANLGVVER